MASPNGDPVYITAGVCLPLMLGFSILRLATGVKHDRKTYIIDESVYSSTGSVSERMTDSMGVRSHLRRSFGLSGSPFGGEAWEGTTGTWTKSGLVLALLAEIFVPLALCSIKVSVLLLYLRVFGGRLRWIRITSIIGIVVNVSYHVSLSIAFGAMCAPSPSMGYDEFAYVAAFASQKCTRTRSLIVVQGVGNVVIDFFLLLLPLPAIWNLQMPLTRKIKTSATFLIGICACVASLIGLAFRVKWYSTGANDFRLVISIIAEMAAGVVICCGPAAAIICRSAKVPIPARISSTRLSIFNRGNQRVSSVPDLPKTDSASWRIPVPKRSGETLEDVWADTEADTYSLQPLNPTHTSIEKPTKLRVARTDF
ncbi:hypothetical protein K461DRAFT_265355 [Myriangium duriaei CBS 260.36]|uniref:Rhodopsin domain-containing protein n=1 Tax=Myriangium duriaei CBS 260.36 TaxID=1168546 RepID=A0A9P4MK38_9PEZI|nr:hypothetical protein K461DRAFT_265355 [Myriangium duriaei CBS 260.36]